MGFDAVRTILWTAWWTSALQPDKVLYLPFSDGYFLCLCAFAAALFYCRAFCYNRCIVLQLVHAVAA
jgi:hypothetical protein